MEYTECDRCSATLSLDDQDNDGLCSYCNYVQKKMMDE
jgi:primosomal protein N'